MYQLFYLPGACSLATQVILRELGQEMIITDKQHVENFDEINPTGAVPVLIDGSNTLVEGAAILLHLFNKHKNSMLPENGDARQQALQDIMFANATMHPAYGRMFFLEQHINDQNAKQTAFNTAAEHINQLWKIVESKLNNKRFLGGNTPSAADIMLTVYSRWGDYFPVDIEFGEKTTEFLNSVQAMPNFKKAEEAEKTASAK